MGSKWIFILINGWIRWRFASIRHISVRELQQELTRPHKQPPVLLDARTASEYGVSHLNQAYLIAGPLEQLEKELGLAKNSRIVVYCSIGYRSALVAQRLQEMGYGQVFNLSGSLFQWVAEGYGVYQGQQVVRQIHPYNRCWQWVLSLVVPQYQFCQGR